MKERTEERNNKEQYKEAKNNSNMLRNEQEKEKIRKEKEELEKKRERQRLLIENLIQERLLKQERERLEKEKQKREEKILNTKVNEKYNKIKEDLPIPFFLDEIKLEKLKNSKNDKCSICLENFVIGKQCLYLPCLHFLY